MKIVLVAGTLLAAAQPAMAQTGNPQNVPPTNENPFGKPELDETKRPDQKAILDRFEDKLYEFQRALASIQCATATLMRLDYESIQERAKVEAMEALVRRMDDDVVLGGYGKDGKQTITKRTRNSLQNKDRLIRLLALQRSLHDAYENLQSCDPGRPDAPRMRGFVIGIGGGPSYFFEPNVDIGLVGLDVDVSIVPRVAIEGQVDIGVTKQSFDNGSTFRTSNGISWSGTAAIAYTLPVGDKAGVSARAGYGAFRFNNSATTFVGGTGTTVRSSNTVGAAILGVGATYDLGGNMELEGRYDRIFFDNGSEGNRIGLSINFIIGGKGG